MLLSVLFSLAAATVSLQTKLAVAELEIRTLQGIYATDTQRSERYVTREEFREWREHLDSVQKASR